MSWGSRSGLHGAIVLSQILVAMAAYLQNWVQNSKDLPAELVRCFKLMQELDQRSHQLQQSVNQAAEELLTKASLHHLSLPHQRQGILWLQVAQQNMLLTIILSYVLHFPCSRAHHYAGHDTLDKIPCCVSQGEGDASVKDSPRVKRSKTDASVSSHQGLHLDEKAEADIAEVQCCSLNHAFRISYKFPLCWQSFSPAWFRRDGGFCFPNLSLIFIEPLVHKAVYRRLELAEISYTFVRCIARPDIRM